MKKYYGIALLIISLIFIFIIFIPRNVEHAIVIKSSGGYTDVIIDGKYKKVKTNTVLTHNSVINYKYNLFTFYDFKEVSPIEERIMAKHHDNYELEISGKIPLNKKCSFYSIDKEGNIKKCSSSELIVGKNDVKSYMAKNKKLKTFVIYPLDYSSMRIGISTTNFSSLYHESISIKCDGDSLLYCKTEKYTDNLPKNSTAEISFNKGKIEISYNGKKTEFKNRVYIKGNGLAVTSIKRGYPSFTPHYDGILEFYPSDKGMMIINEIYMEDYLKKVVPSEMPSSGGLSSLECQAVAARTYAISDMLRSRYAEYGFYVDDSTQSQVYNNICPNSLSDKAVENTKGLIMTYNGNPIDAKYYSTSCGMGVMSRDIWFNSDGSGDAAPYLKTKSYMTGNTDIPVNEKDWLNFFKNTNIKSIDSNSPYYRWSIKFSKESLENCLNKSLKAIYKKNKGYMTIMQSGRKVSILPTLKNLKDIKILKRSTGGNIIEISFIFKNTTVNVKEDYFIRSAIRCSKEYAGTQIPVYRYKASPLLSNNFLPSSFFSVEKSGDYFMLYGGGYGHGVGMSQYGAMNLSKEGMKFEDILKTYYSDIDLGKIF